MTVNSKYDGCCLRDIENDVQMKNPCREIDSGIEEAKMRIKTSRFSIIS